MTRGASFLPRTIAILSLLLSVAATAPSSWAQDDSDTARIDGDSRGRQIASRLIEVQQTLIEKRQQLQSQQRQLDTATEDDLRQELRQEIDQLNADIKALNRSFEQIAVGGVDIAALSDQPEQPFDWQQELIQITKPILDSLKKLTEKPRQIERLRSEITRLENRLRVTENALRAANGVDQQALPPPAIEKLRGVIDDWQQRRSDIERELEITRFQLAGLQGQTGSWFDSVRESLAAFFRGRGLTLLIALLAAGTAWLITRSTVRLYIRHIIKPGERRTSTQARLAVYLFQLVSGLLILISALAVFYIRGDMLLLAITLLVVFFAALGFRHTLPRYVNEIRLLLNIGPVREGERVMYQGLPMEVRSLNLFVILRNPDLEGIVRLPLSALEQLVSRPFAKTEPWFPCRAGDYVMLPDGTFGQVQRQTLEHVVLQSIGSSVLYSSAAFLQANARNLSREGYAIVATFGLDYRHQAISLDTVPARLRDALIEAFRQADFGDALESLLVEFKAAAAHSLDYLIVASLNGRAASAYYRAGRLVQQTCVAVCNQEHWVIPFNQLTLHQGEGFARLARQTSE